MKSARHILSLLTLTIAVAAIADPISLAVAKRYFQEARWASDDDGGKLWGRPLYGPMMFADPATRKVVANQPDKEGKLKNEDGLWTGVLPAEVGIANTALDWAGVHWTMVMPDALEGASAVRVQVMMHECWHRIQSELGLPPSPQQNGHLDTQDGRIWLRLEWRALSTALLRLEDEPDTALRDALLFRAFRRSLFGPDAGAQEDRMEVHEGLAEYTGVRLMGLGDWSRSSYMAGRVRHNAHSRPSYPLSFAYETGPCYGILLDHTGKPWRAKLTANSSLSDILREAAGIILPADIKTAAFERGKAYGLETVAAEEHKREADRKAAETKWRSMLVDGPVLELPLVQMNYTYDPNTVFQLGPDGSVFPQTRVAEDWGVIEVQNGARLSSDRKSIFVSAPVAGNLANANWKLTLNPGWKLVPGKRKGDFTVTKT